MAETGRKDKPGSAYKAARSAWRRKRADEGESPAQRQERIRNRGAILASLATRHQEVRPLEAIAAEAAPLFEKRERQRERAAANRPKARVANLARGAKTRDAVAAATAELWRQRQTKKRFKTASGIATWLLSMPVEECVTRFGRDFRKGTLSTLEGQVGVALLALEQAEKDRK